MRKHAKRFLDRRVVVTGASSGVGRAIARAFGAEGAKVALLARTREGLEHCAREIERLGGEALVLPTDVSDAAAVERAAAEIDAKWGGVDIWVNDAMVSVFAPAQETAPEEYERVTRVTYLGAVYGTLAALRRMTRQNHGYILQIGSALAYCSIPLQSAYCASKSALRGFTDSVRIELRHDGSDVRIGMIQLPAVNTPQFEVVRSRLPHHPQPVPPIFQPETIAEAALYACEHRSRELWLGLSTLKAIVGHFFARRFVEEYLARHGYTSQQQMTLPPKRDDDNVDRPLPGDKGAHGRFDGRSVKFSPAVWLRTHPDQAVMAGLVALAGAAITARHIWKRNRLV